MLTGDGESQPVEGVDALDDLAESLVPESEKAKAPDPDEPEGDDSEDAEEVEESDEDESEDADEDEEESTVKLKHDGKEIELKLSEALNLAQQGFDYTQKTMAVAEKSKAVEVEREQATQARTQAEQHVQETLHRLEAYSQYMQAQIGSPPDVSLASHDVGRYIAEKEAWEARKGQLQEARAAVSALQDEQARQRQAWIADKAATTERALKDTLPGWNDDTLHELAEYAGKLGLTPNSADVAMLEPGFWQLVSKAKAYDAVQAQKAQMKPKAQLAKVDKPQAKNQSGKVGERIKREAAFNKNPSVDALADILFK